MVGTANRALRRHHKARMKKRAKFIYGTVLGIDKPNVGKYADNITRCSCEMCRNPRRVEFLPPHEKRTVQELRFYDSATNQEKE